jgi:Aldehyde dehydrogenase family
MQAGIYDQFSKAVVEQVKKFKLGDGLVDGTTLGPLISPAAVDRVRPQSRPPAAPAPAVASMTCTASVLSRGRRRSCRPSMRLPAT